MAPIKWCWKRRWRSSEVKVKVKVEAATDGFRTTATAFPNFPSTLWPIMTRSWQAAPKSLSTCQMASAGMSIVVLQEAWVIRDCYLACSR
jgi:hypothetical protein